MMYIQPASWLVNAPDISYIRQLEWLTFHQFNLLSELETQRCLHFSVQRNGKCCRLSGFFHSELSAPKIRQVFSEERSELNSVIIKLFEIV